MGQYWSKYGPRSKNELNNPLNNELNNELISEFDNFHNVYNKVVHSPYVEMVFRCVDRRFYFNKHHHANGYLNFNYHIERYQSRSMNAEAIECLELKPGDKFLAIGSGVGYFNTIAGLLLGKF